MSFRDPRVLAWEETLKRVFDEIDHQLEDQYGGTYPLHPARAARGKTANPESDGLFNIGASFSPGYGSRSGRGYVVDARMATPAAVPEHVILAIEEDVAARLRVLLPEHFPGRNLEVVRDGHVFKITGDLSF